MKTKLSVLLVLILSAFCSSGAVIVGTSDPFPLNTSSSAVPVTWFALAVFAGLIGMYIVLRNLRISKKASA